MQTIINNNVLSTNTPPIVTNGLVYNLMIGNSSSYSGSGSTINNISGTALGAATAYSSPTYTANGNGSYLTFNGTNQYIYTSNLVSAFNPPSNETLTLEIWASAPSDNGVLLDERGQIGLGWQDSTMELVSGTLYMRLWDLPGINAGTFPRTQWNHCVLTYDGTTVRSYLNGVAGGTTTGNRQVPWVDGSSGNRNYYYGIMLGDTTNMGDGSNLAGNFGQFRIYNRPLTTAEILQNYNATKPYYYNAGLLRTRYSGYFADDVNWFSTATVVASDTNLSPITPGYTGDNYSIQWLGYFTPTTTETYTFYTSSDDASYLWVGNTALTGYTTTNAIVQNGGLHGMQERSGSIALTAGVYYPIRIQFGEQAGGDDCVVNYSTPTITKTTDFSGLIFNSPSFTS